MSRAPTESREEIEAAGTTSGAESGLALGLAVCGLVVSLVCVGYEPIIAFMQWPAWKDMSELAQWPMWPAYVLEALAGGLCAAALIVQRLQPSRAATAAVILATTGLCVVLLATLSQHIIL